MLNVSGAQHQRQWKWRVLCRSPSGVNNFQSFLSSQLRRRGVEVSERNMDDEELKLMQTAKQEEVKKFIGADALKCLPPHLQPSKQVAMKMRWVLTWKRGDDGTRSPKTRCVVLGFKILTMRVVKRWLRPCRGRHVKSFFILPQLSR